MKPQQNKSILNKQLFTSFISQKEKKSAQQKGKQFHFHQNCKTLFYKLIERYISCELDYLTVSSIITLIKYNVFFSSHCLLYKSAQ